MREIIIELSISADEYMKNYRYPAAVVKTHSLDGRRVQFPANILQPYVTHTGISGRFRIGFDSQGKFQSISPC